MSAPRVAVVGGGIAGLSVAWFLRLGGAEVTVLERSQVGSGASAGNAGWLTPAQAGPLPAPGVAAYGLRSLPRRDAPLSIAPAHLPRMLPWLVRFARHCNARDYRSGLEALERLGRRTFALAERLHDDGVDVELRRDGFLLAAERREELVAFLDGLAPLRPLGWTIPERPLDGAAARELEPALSGAVTCGALIEQHWHVDPLALVQALAARLRERGAVVEEGVEVLGLGDAGGRDHLLRTSSGERRADVVVLAAGAWSGALARQLGLRLPLQAGKGYSFELRPERMPVRSFELLDAHVGCTPLGGRLRIAGTMEFSGVNRRLDARRVEAIVRSASRLLPLVAELPIENRWCGLRPIAPDGLPVIDRVPGRDGAYVATAYSMLGMTLGAPAGEALAHLILTGERPPELEPFRADRFGRRRRG